MQSPKVSKPKKSTWQRLLNINIYELRQDVDHVEVVDHVHEEGALTGRYIFMVIMSCAIAILGLLLSSPAVVIGAMLISPLMGPIMLLGFSLSILDFSALKKAFKSIVIGLLAAVLISYVITVASPLSEATPEILARTRPNFFDLLVAIFSGLAGGYAVITRKGEAIVGVAIATALMPPLAVTGYGLAVGSMQIAGGSFFLFMTNLLAIAISVTILSRLYGFGKTHCRRRNAGQGLLIIAVFTALSIPLGISLRDIAYETQVTNSIKGEILTPFADVPSRLSDLTVTFPSRTDLNVEATVLTRERVAGAQNALQSRLSEKMGRNVTVSLGQVLINQDIDLEQAKFLELANTSLAAPLRAEISRIETLSQTRRSEAELRNAVAFKLAGADINGQTQSASFFAARQAGFSAASYQAIEAGLSKNFSNWDIKVVPPVSDLPLINFANGVDDISPEMTNAFETIAWALKRWDISRIEAVGYASTSGAVENFDNRSLAFRRASNAAAYFTRLGFEAEPIGEYRVFRQTQQEKVFGYQRFQSVLIRPHAESADAGSAALR